MSKIAVRLLVLTIFATPLLLVPVTPADAATTSSKHYKKKRVAHQNPRAVAPAAKSYSNDPYGDDPDRRAGGGGGGY